MGFLIPGSQVRSLPGAPRPLTLQNPAQFLQHLAALVRIHPPDVLQFPLQGRQVAQMRYFQHIPVGFSLFHGEQELPLVGIQAAENQASYPG